MIHYASPHLVLVERAAKDLNRVQVQWASGVQELLAFATAGWAMGLHTRMHETTILALARARPGAADSPWSTLISLASSIMASGRDLVCAGEEAHAVH